MNFKNKKFTDLSSGRVIEVKDHFEDIAILNDNSKIRVNRLLDKNYFEEYIDPKSFFKNESLLSNFADKIRQLPPDVVHLADDSPRSLVSPAESGGNFNPGNISGSTVVRPSINESAVLPYDPEEEKMELLRKAQSMYGNATLSQELQKQYDSVRALIEDDSPNIPVVEPHRPRPVNPPREVVQENPVVSGLPAFQRIEVNREEVYESPTESPKKSEFQNDPITEMFRNVKRNTKFEIQIPIKNMIPRSDFIEMLEDSYNKSIIDFLAQEFTDEIVGNPEKIKEMIVGKIREIVYSGKKSVNPVKDKIESALESPKPVKKQRTVSPKKESEK